MKSLSRVFGTAIGLVIASALLTVATTASAALQQGKALVRSVKGTAEYSTGGAWAPLKAGAVLGSGSIVKTGPDSEVNLNLGVNGQGIVVIENTTLGLDKLVFDQTGADTVAETQLDLKVGRILGNIKKSSPASRFEVKTPTGVAGIRGTKFDIAANGVTKVKDGCVVVVYVDPSGQVSTHEVCGGFKFVPGVGVVPMTNEEMKDKMWDKFASNDRQVRVQPIDGGGLIFVAPLIGAPVSGTTGTNPPALTRPQ